MLATIKSVPVVMPMPEAADGGLAAGRAIAGWDDMDFGIVNWDFGIEQ
jgi:hypothetical protein